MSIHSFPADSSEHQEYVAVMEAMANEMDTLPDPQPEDFNGRCEDAPCCGCCSNGEYARSYDDDLYSREREYRDEHPNDSHLDGSWEQYPYEPEDQYLDSSWEDANEYGMEGCCGDF
jgi:hypothetical protein